VSQPRVVGTPSRVLSGVGTPSRVLSGVESEVRVRYAETDAEGVVYYANHFVYMEVGRINFLRTLGIDRAFWQRAGVGLVIVEASCKYRAPAHFDDLLVIHTSLEEVRRSSFSMRYDILNQQSKILLAEGRTVQVFVDLKTMRTMRLPPEAYALLRAAAPPNQDAAAPPGSATGNRVPVAQADA
jgi:acyl-CoA thioester hydrolase